MHHRRTNQKTRGTHSAQGVIGLDDGRGIERQSLPSIEVGVAEPVLLQKDGEEEARSRRPPRPSIL